ncbi:hypothetical protein ACFGVR_14990 [Mucilaginibacter sp. AW1-3]
MKSLRLLLLVAVSLFAFVMTSRAQVNPSQVWVPGYTRSDGTYVNGYYKTTPNSTNRDNFTTKPNVNPYTGQPGYIQPDSKPAPTVTYSTPTTTTTPVYTPATTATPAVYTGPRGGQYYINSKGHKVYIKP